MQPHVLLPPRNSEDTTRIWRAAVARKWPTTRLQRWQVPAHLTAEKNDWIIYGEPILAYAVADSLPIELVEPDAEWLTKISRIYTSRAIWSGSFQDAIAHDRPVFVKPLSLTKPFTAKLYRDGNELYNTAHVECDEAVLMSEPVQWLSEYRCFVLNREPVTISAYEINGEPARNQVGEWTDPQPEERKEVECFISEMLKDHAIELPESIVIDAGRLSDGSIAVIEANSSWGSGLYGCDTSKALDVIAKATITKH